MTSRTWSRSHWYAEVNTSPVSRPQFQAAWADERQWYISLSWGTPGCDPVWMVEYHRTVSEPVGRIVDRWYAWLERVRPSSPAPSSPRASAGG